MKALIFSLLLVLTCYGQVKFISSTLDTADIDIWSSERPFTNWYITVDLPDSADVITVYTATNNPDSTTATNETWTQARVLDITSEAEAITITGDEAQHTFLIMYADKRKNIKLVATTWSATISYILEAY